MKKRTLSLLLALGMTLSMPALAAEEETVPAASGEPVMQEIAPWAYDAMSECEALGMLEDSYLYCIQDPVTGEQMDKLAAAVADKLALLELPVNTASTGPDALVVDTTRGGVMNALYQEAAGYRIDGVDQGADGFLTGLGVVQGDQNGDLHRDRTCTLQEALVMAQRLVINVYDHYDAGSRGLLWKATGNGNTLYLLGTIHVDRGNIYPFHKTLRDAITSSQLLALEVDFGDTEGGMAFAAMQLYDDGTTLKDHVSEALYTQASDILKTVGLTQEQIDGYRAWALAATISQLGLSDESTGEAPVAVDMYVYIKAMNYGLTVDGVESYVFQGEIFNNLSEEYQEAYLASAIEMYKVGTTGQGDSAATGMDQIDAMLDTWKTGDPVAFDKVYDKQAILESDDELNVKLFTDRDPGMIAYADAYLKQAEGGHTGMMAVGAGHMVGQTGVVQGLLDLGYTVEVVE